MTSHITVTLNDPFTTDDIDLLQTLYNRQVATAAGTTATTTPMATATSTASASKPAPAATASAATSYFPADPGSAPFPSPENSNSIWLNGAVSGDPYLRDANGNIYQIKPAAAGWVAGASLVNGAPDNGARLYVNGVMIEGGYPVASMIVRQGMIYLTIASGQIQYFNSGMGATYNTSLPPAFVPGTSTAPAAALPPLPTDPVPASVAPGSSGRTLTVPVGTAIQTVVSAAQAGDTVVVSPGTYTAGATWAVPLKLVLTGAVLDLAGQTANLPHGLGALTPFADSIIQDGEIKNVAMDQTTAQLTSAIRPGASCYLTINGTYMHDNQVGVGQGGFACVIVLNNCKLDSNGLGDGYTHNIYTHGNSLTLNNVISTNPRGGHAVKSRDPQLTINGGDFSASDATLIDMSDGTTTKFQITNATLNKSASDANHGILGYAMESTTNGATGGSITGSTINAACNSPLIQTQGGTIVMSGVTVMGNKITASGSGTVTGL